MVKDVMLTVLVLNLDTIAMVVTLTQHQHVKKSVVMMLSLRMKNVRIGLTHLHHLMDVHHHV